MDSSLINGAKSNSNKSNDPVNNQATVPTVDQDYETKYWEHLFKDVETTSSEIYTLCCNTKNKTMCKEMLLKYQQLAYDFSNLLEYLKYKEEDCNICEPKRSILFKLCNELKKSYTGTGVTGSEHVFFLSNHQFSPFNKMEKDKEVKEDDNCDHSILKSDNLGKEITPSHHETNIATRLGTNILAPSFVPSQSSETVPSCLSNTPYQHHHVYDESIENYSQSFHRSSPNLSPSFNVPPYSSFQPRGLWHVPPHQPYSQFPHYHVGSNFIALPQLTHFPSSPIFPNSLHYPYHYNNSYPQSILHSNQLYVNNEEQFTESDSSVDNSNCKNRQLSHDKFVSSIQSLPHKTVKEVGIKPENDSSNNNLILDKSEVVNTVRIINVELDNYKEEITKKIPSVIDNVQSSGIKSFSEKCNITENNVVPLTKINNSPPKILNAEHSTIIENSGNVKQQIKCVSLFGLPEDEHCRQFPPLQHERSLYKKQKNKSLKVKFHKKQKCNYQNFQTFTEQWCQPSSPPPTLPLSSAPSQVLTYSLITEKPRISNPSNSQSTIERQGQSRSSRRANNLKKGTPSNDHMKYRRQDQINGDKNRLHIHEYLKEPHWRSRKKNLYPVVIEDGWQTVRYKTKETYPVSQTCLSEMAKDPSTIIKKQPNAVVSSVHESECERFSLINTTSTLSGAKINKGVGSDEADIQKDDHSLSPSFDKHNGINQNSSQLNNTDSSPNVDINLIQEQIVDSNDEDISDTVYYKSQNTNMGYIAPQYSSPGSDSKLYDDSYSIAELSGTSYPGGSSKGISEDEASDCTGANSPGQLDLPIDNNAQDMFKDFMQYLNSISWAAQMDEIENVASLFAEDPNQPCELSFINSYTSPTVEHFEDFIVNDPEHALKFRQEISMKYKQVKEVETKQKQAYEKRQQLLQCKTAKVREFVQKVEVVKAAKYKMALEKKSQIDLKLKKAEENRNLHLSIIKRKAHDEEEKLKEIAFINELEAQNRRHDSLVLRQEHEERIQTIIEERQRKVEEKAAKDAAVEERRKMLEAERQAQLLEISEKRKKKEENIYRKQQEREKERLEIAREKAREREERLLARQAAQLAVAEELQKRIQQKQEESARRHEENIELIRQKALEVGLHKTTEEVPSSCNCKPEEQKDKTEETHHYSYNELKPSFKKRLKKIRTRMLERGLTYLKTITCMPITSNDILVTELKVLDKLILIEEDNQRKYSYIDNKVTRIIDLMEAGTRQYLAFKNAEGFIIVTKLINMMIELSPSSKQTPSFIKCLISIVKLIDTVTTDCHLNLHYIVCSNDIVVLLDLIHFCFTKIKGRKEEWIVLIKNLCSIMSELLKQINGFNEELPGYIEFSKQIPDMVSYFVCSGIVHDIIDLLRIVIIDGWTHLSSLVTYSIDMFTILLSNRFYCKELSNLLKVTDCLETVYLLYEALQKMSAMSSNTVPKCAHSIILMLVEFAIADIALFQNVLGAEGMALQIRSITSTIITLCSQRKEEENLLLAVIQLVGFFAMHNGKNQALLQSGQQPTVLQLLINLPFQYFCDEKYKIVLFPTLLACTFENAINKAIAESELSYNVLEKFTTSKKHTSNKLIEMFFNLQIETLHTNSKPNTTKNDGSIIELEEISLEETVLMDEEEK